jgi:hypothetical protein
VRKGGTGEPNPIGINLKRLEEMGIYKNGWWNTKYRAGLTLPVISPAHVIPIPAMPTMPIVAPRIVLPRIFIPEMLPIL